LVCTARSPRCEDCPLASRGCAWFDAGRPQPEPGTRRGQPFDGTDRQMRGQIMARLRTSGSAEEDELTQLDHADPQRVRRCMDSLDADGLAVRDGTALRLP